MYFCFTRTFLQNELFTVICVVVLVHYLWGASLKLLDTKTMEVFNRTDLTSKESLEIMLCPMPRVNVGRMFHLGKNFHKFLYYETNKELVRYLNEKEPKMKINSIFRCLVQNHKLKLSSSTSTTFALLYNTTKCWPTIGYAEGMKTAIKRTQAHFNHTLVSQLFTSYGLWEEKLLADYTRLFEKAWMLKYEKMTLKDYMNVLTIKLQNYIDEEKLALSLADVTGPKQELEESVVQTRFARCLKHVLKGSPDPGFQRSEIVYSFRTSCTAEETGAFPAGSLCRDAKDIYVVMYVTSLNTFTDVLSAATIVPLRLAIDAESVLHISMKKKILQLESDCKFYDQPNTYVTCVEDCLMKNILSKIKCIVPWIHRTSKRFESAYKLRFCETAEDIASTSETVSRIFDESFRSNCTTQCQRGCKELIITHRLMGSINSTDSRLVLLISDQLSVFSEQFIYGAGQFTVEVMGSLSFMVGVSVVVLYDWLIGLALWLMGKLPFIPAMPPLLRHEIYTAGMCKCCPKGSLCGPRPEGEEDEDEAGEDDVMTAEEESFLADSFRTHQSSLGAGFGFSSVSKHRPSAQHGSSRHSVFPGIEVRPSAMHTLAQALTANSSGSVAPDRSSISAARRRSASVDNSGEKPHLAKSTLATTNTPPVTDAEVTKPSSAPKKRRRSKGRRRSSRRRSRRVSSLPHSQEESGSVEETETASRQETAPDTKAGRRVTLDVPEQVAVATQPETDGSSQDDQAPSTNTKHREAPEKPEQDEAEDQLAAPASKERLPSIFEQAGQGSLRQSVDSTSPPQSKESETDPDRKRSSQVAMPTDPAQLEELQQQLLRLESAAPSAIPEERAYRSSVASPARGYGTRAAVARHSVAPYRSRPRRKTLSPVKEEPADVSASDSVTDDSRDVGD